MCESLVDKLSSQKEVMTELEEKLQKNGETTAELETQLKSLKNSLECLREEQEREQKMLEEALKLLTSLVPSPSNKPSPKGAIDSAVQTSPEPEQSVHNILQNSQPEGTQLSSAPNNLSPIQAYRRVFGRRKLKLKGLRRKKRPLVLSQRSKQSVPDENNEPMNPCKKPQIISGPLHERCDQNTLAEQQSLSSGSPTPAKRGSRADMAAGCFITPLSCWSQDSNNSECLAAIEPILERLSADSKMGTPVKHVDFWQLFESELDF
ncbi:hypothetical protein GOODEAATRI_002721 [Goodea atripinnis]|uniref:Uncharacterized protein n=1 Tax=Goodea atripinnis TaxID=208336 RepID=A0ABV0PK95_9TELE